MITINFECGCIVLLVEKPIGQEWTTVCKAYGNCKKHEGNLKVSSVSEGNPNVSR